MPEKSALYGALAEYYDQIYHWKDYRKETKIIKNLIRKHKRSSGNDLLDVACGTGKHIEYLMKEFDCVGIDASEQMLAVAKRNVPSVKFVRRSMVSFDLGRQFDVVLCLFSSMGYLKTEKEVERAFSAFAKHLKKGGVLIVEPWIGKADWKDRTVHMQTYDSDSLKIVRVNYSWAKGNLSIMDYRYLVAEKGKGVRYFRDLHKMRFFEVAPALSAARKAGLKPKFVKESLMPGRGLLIATK